MLAQKDIDGMIYGSFRVDDIHETNGTVRLVGYAFGEPFDEKKHEVKTEVKAATYSGLKCGQGDCRSYIIR